MESGSERELRERLEQALGKQISDEEWEGFKRAAKLPSDPPVPAAPRAVRAGRAVASGTVTLLAWVFGPLLVGAVVYGLVVGLLWAYHPSGLEDEDFGTGALLVTAWFIGFITIGSAVNYPRATTVLGGLGLVVGGVALAIGALFKAAG
jgi:hypothetical protein